ncbi:MAG: LysM peptidoglycan-binding domain-containing protein [Alphaproteobacteria bacterium]|nr:LysM peptidoglycan-binding domain-containing protein [Alphaproteobacteria bacterium]
MVEKKDPTLSKKEKSEKLDELNAKFSNMNADNSGDEPSEMPEQPRDRLGRFCKSKKGIAIVIGAIVIILGLLLLLFTMGKKDAEGTEVETATVKTIEERIAPSFDIVRMEKGELVISGRAAKGDVVHILDNGSLLGKETADENGQWVHLPKRALAPGNHKLTLYVIVDDKRIHSKQSALLRVSANSKEEVGVLMGNNQSSRIIKAPKGEDIGALRIEKLDYNESGRFALTGNAKAGTTVKVYANEAIVGSARAGSDNRWTLNSDFRLENGKRYTLRADMVENDKVARRISYNFTPEFVSGKGEAVIIKRGDNLWNISLKEYGRGADYVAIFEANRNAIKDPNLIFPKQVFTLPAKDGVVAARGKKAAAAKPAPKRPESSVERKKKAEQPAAVPAKEAGKPRPIAPVEIK